MKTKPKTKPLPKAKPRPPRTIVRKDPPVTYGDRPSLRADQTPPLFACTEGGQPVVVRVDPKVVTSGQAKIVGREWGPDSYRRKCRGWCYTLLALNAVGSGLGQDFYASEEELVAWQRSAK